MNRSKYLDEKFIGKRFGSRIVIGLGTPYRNHIRYVCKCDCGHIGEVVATTLVHGRSQKCHNCRSKIEPFLASYNHVVDRIKRDAMKRKYAFELDESKLREKLTSNCFYCNASPANKVTKSNLHNGIFVYNGLDRVDNSVGYIESNVVPCCKHCNGAKSMMSLPEFKQWIIKAYENFASK